MTQPLNTINMHWALGELPVDADGYRYFQLNILIDGEPLLCLAERKFCELHQLEPNELYTAYPSFTRSTLANLTHCEIDNYFPALHQPYVCILSSEFRLVGEASCWVHVEYDNETVTWRHFCYGACDVVPDPNNSFWNFGPFIFNRIEYEREVHKVTLAATNVITLRWLNLDSAEHLVLQIVVDGLPLHTVVGNRQWFAETFFRWLWGRQTRHELKDSPLKVYLHEWKYFLSWQISGENVPAGGYSFNVHPATYKAEVLRALTEMEARPSS